MMTAIRPLVVTQVGVYRPSGPVMYFRSTMTNGLVLEGLNRLFEMLPDLMLKHGEGAGLEVAQSHDFAETGVWEPDNVVLVVPFKSMNHLKSTKGSACRTLFNMIDDRTATYGHARYAEMIGLLTVLQLAVDPMHEALELWDVPDSEHGYMQGQLEALVGAITNLGGTLYALQSGKLQLNPPDPNDDDDLVA